MIVVLAAMFILFPMIYGNLMENAERGDPGTDRYPTSSPVDLSSQPLAPEE